MKRYPDDLGRYFQVLRQNGLSMKRAATCHDDSRGTFERWQFSQDPGKRDATSVKVRFWHDTRDLDWRGIISDGGEIKEQASGQTLAQLQAQLELWKGE